MPYEYLLDERLVNHMDCAWSITHIAQRSNYLSTERALGVSRRRHNL
jgi:hypothetical protein